MANKASVNNLRFQRFQIVLDIERKGYKRAQMLQLIRDILHQMYILPNQAIRHIHRRISIQSFGKIFRLLQKTTVLEFQIMCRESTDTDDVQMFRWAKRSAIKASHIRGDLLISFVFSSVMKIRLMCKLTGMNEEEKSRFRQLGWNFLSELLVDH